MRGTNDPRRVVNFRDAAAPPAGLAAMAELAFRRAGWQRWGMTSSIILRTIGLLVLSNTFMLFAWYGHLKTLGGRAWYVAAVVSWSIALFEYLLQVPANRMGFGVLSLAQLKILQEIVTLTVFVPFALFYMRQPIKLDYLWAGLCLVGAAYFTFRS